MHQASEDLPAPPATGRRILFYVLSLSGFVAVVRLAGLVEKQVLAYFFGAGVELDSYTIALSVPMAFMLGVTGVLNPTFLPMFVRRCMQNDRSGAWSQFHTWAILLLAVLGLSAIAVAAAPGLTVKAFAPGFSTDQSDLCQNLLRMLFPAIVFLGTLPLLRSALNGQRNFSTPPVGDLLQKIMLIAMLGLLGATLGIRAAAWGALLGAAASMAYHAFAVKRVWMNPLQAPPSFRDPDFRHVLLLMSAPALGTAFSRFGSIVENAACSTLAPGSVAGLEFARKIVGLPLIIVPVACGTVLFTFFAESAHRNDAEHSARLLGAGLRAMLFIFLPLAGLTALLSEPITAVVYQRGHFDAESTAIVGFVLTWLAPLMCFEAIEALLMRHFFSREDYWPPVLLGIACVVLKVLLIFGTVGTFGVAAVACAIVTARAVKTLALTGMAIKRGNVSIHHLALADLGKVLISAAIALLAAYATRLGLASFLGNNLAGRLALLTAAGSIALILYLATAWSLGLPECRQAATLLKQRLRRPTAPCPDPSTN